MAKFNIFIHTNKNNLISALVSRDSYLEKNPDVDIDFIHLEDCNKLNSMNKKVFKRNGRDCMLDIDKHQSFFFARFAIENNIHKFTNPSNNWILISDPDIFCLKNLSILDNFIDKAEKTGKPIIAFKNFSSMMLIDRRHIRWTEDLIVEEIFEKGCDADDFMFLKRYNGLILDLPQAFNSMDRLDENTYLLHSSKAEYQPWKTGIKYKRSDLHNLPPSKLKENEESVWLRFKPHPNKALKSKIILCEYIKNLHQSPPSKQKNNIPEFNYKFF